MKVVINKCYGGFGLSHEAQLRYLELAGKKVWVMSQEHEALLGPLYSLVAPEQRLNDTHNWHEMTIDERKEYNRKYSEQTFNDSDLKRDDPLLVRVVEEMGGGANGRSSSLKIVEIPDGVEWEIEEYDGNEWVSEAHRTWG